jgi:CRISPR-associated endonuclease Csn1
MEASHRVKGINRDKQPIVKINHGDKWEFLMALHANDTVSIEKDNGERIFYRVQKMGAISAKLTLRLNIASTISNKNEEVEASISTIFEQNAIRVHRVNAIGRLMDD